jgi:hypothetical protein
MPAAPFASGKGANEPGNVVEESWSRPFEHRWRFELLAINTAGRSKAGATG